jgi:hypothetical protein
MARIAKNSACLAPPADAPFTPGTFDQQIQIARVRVLLWQVFPSWQKRCFYFPIAIIRGEHWRRLTRAFQFVCHTANYHFYSLGYLKKLSPDTLDQV